MNDILDSVMERVGRWQLEAFDAHNDGWTQNGYRKNLIELRDYLNNIEGLKLHREGEDA